MLSAQQDAWNTGDLEGLRAGYANMPDLVFTSGSKIRRGWQETHDKASSGQRRSIGMLVAMA